MVPEIFKGQSIDPNNFFLIAGPCVVENAEMMEETGSKLAAMCKRLGIPLIFKASYRKANRTSASSFSGIGDIPALNLLNQTARNLALPCITDVHAPAEAEIAAGYVDALQIPAFLCRQTDLLSAAAKTGKTVNVKKGQFLSGPSMKFAVEKIRNAGNNNIWLTERGNSFGYTDLVVDFRNIPWMKETGVPVIVDCTHSLQQPNQPAGVTGGNPELISTIASCAIASGADGLFIETHPNPSIAKSDGANMLHLERMESLLEKLVRMRNVVKS